MWRFNYWSRRTFGWLLCRFRGSHRPDCLVKRSGEVRVFCRCCLLILPASSLKLEG
jgi:hypothetical protein